jgi:hypothetical protein
VLSPYGAQHHLEDAVAAPDAAAKSACSMSVERTVLAHNLLFGKRQTIGAVHVVLPMFASSAPQIEHTVPVASRHLAP